jgi:hypothetical protein
MSKLDILLLAFKNFSRRKARSALTIIGVVIGCMAIIIMVSLGIGIQENMTAMVEQWGDLTTINVNFWNLDQDGGSGSVVIRGGGSVVVSGSGGGSGGGGGRNRRNQGPNIYEQAIMNIEALPNVVTAMAMNDIWHGFRFVSGRYTTQWASLMIMDTSKLHYFDIGTSQGRMIMPGDGEFAVVLNPHLGTEFLNMRLRDPWSNRPTDEFGNMLPLVDLATDPIQITFDDTFGQRPTPGQTQRRRARLHDVEIVGLQQEMGMYQWRNFMDMETFNNHRREHLREQIRGMSREEAQWIQNEIDNLDNFMQALVRVDHRDNVSLVMDQLRDLGYDAWSNIEWIENVDQQMQTIQLVMGAIGAVALLVAAINIANTMIMSIYERTKEIGIMKVIGCRLGDVCQLFLLEAGLIGLIGGVIGVAASFVASILLNNLPPEVISGFFGFHVDPNVGASISVIPFWLVLLAMGIAVGIAVLAGLYPSIRAMRLSALEAIRTE